MQQWLDTTYAHEVIGQMQCEDETPVTVGIRRKRSGGQTKVGFKVDINQFVSGQAWYGLKKLSLENGVSEGSNEDGGEVRAYVAEYLAWRLMVLSGAISGRAAFVKVQVNDQVLGVYVNVEQVDKRFLQTRFGDDSGWLYKKSGGVNDGLKTNELNGAPTHTTTTSVSGTPAATVVQCRVRSPLPWSCPGASTYRSSCGSAR